MELMLILLLLLIIGIAYYCYKFSGMSYVKSDVDQKYYLVCDLEDKQFAANLLAKIKKNIYMLSNHLYENYNNIDNINYTEHKDAIVQLHHNIHRLVLAENSINNDFTSFTINKGDKMVLCIRSKDLRRELYNINLLMYVVLHEMAHIGCDEYGHTEKFKKIFAFLCNQAIELKLYQKMDFKNHPQPYCGITISDSII